MDTESVAISVGLPPESSGKIAAMYFDIFSRKLSAVLGRRSSTTASASLLPTGVNS